MDAETRARTAGHDVDDGYGHSVMSSLPPEKAGVGSAVNDSVGQVGGALGVAVLESILSSVYGGRLPADVAGVPVPSEASEGLGATMRVASQLEGDSAVALVGAAQEAFVHAMDVTVVVAARITLAGAVVAAVWMPGRIGSRRCTRPRSGGGRGRRQRARSGGVALGDRSGPRRVTPAGARAC